MSLSHMVSIAGIDAYVLAFAGAWLLALLALYALTPRS